MTERQFEGRSVAEAAIKACETLGVTRSNLRYRVVSETGELLDRRVVIAVNEEASPKTPALAQGQVKPVTMGSHEDEDEGDAAPRRQEGERGADEAGQSGERRSARGARGGRTGGARGERSGGRSSSGGERSSGRSGGRSGGGRSERSGGRSGGGGEGRRRTGGGAAGAHADDGIDALLKMDNQPKPLAPRPQIEPQGPRAKRAVTVVGDLTRLMGMNVAAHLISDAEEEMHIDLVGADENRIIGKRGEVLLSLQFIVNRIINRGEEEGDQVLVLDAGSYRQRRRGALEDLARRLATRAVEEGKAVRLSPMSAHDRRVFHLTLKEMDGITTRSEGDGLYRNLLIIPSQFIS